MTRILDLACVTFAAFVLAFGTGCVSRQTIDAATAARDTVREIGETLRGSVPTFGVGAK